MQKFFVDTKHKKLNLVDFQITANMFQRHRQNKQMRPPTSWAEWNNKSRKNYTSNIMKNNAAVDATI